MKLPLPVIFVVCIFFVHEGESAEAFDDVFFQMVRSLDIVFQFFNSKIKQWLRKNGEQKGLR